MSSSRVSIQTLAWLLAAQLLILLPLAVELPLWLMGLALLVMIWRLQLGRGRWSYPGPWLKVFLAFMVMGALALTFQSFAMNAMVSLLVAGFVLKLVELKTRTDVSMLCYLSYFVIGTQLLYTSGFFGSLYALLCVLGVTVALMRNHMASGSVKQLRPFKTILLMFLQAIPLMLILFFVVPRVGSLWTVPLNSATGKTGVSSSMSPGDIASLMKSDEVALRATFTGDIPPARELYWRGLVLDYFDGRTWSQSSFHDVKGRRYVRWQNSDKELQVNGESYAYEVMLEPTDENWLYALAAPVTFSDGIWLSRGMTLFQRGVVSQRKQYSVRSYPEYTSQAQGMSDLARRLSLQLPRGVNPKTRALAQQWRAEEATAEALIQRFLSYIRDYFHYTLQPPVLGEHSVDEFLLETQMGFCEHFAGSFVFFMRAAGIPARVVVGYQGGRVNPLENYLTVRQLDAHAWAEVWLAGKGWVRVDPTFAVAPERIDRGVEYSLDSEDSALLGDAWSRRFHLLSNLQLRLDAFNYRWHRWVMNYDRATQKALMARLFGQSPPWRIVLLVIVAVALILLLVILPSWIRRQGGRRLKIERLYDKFCRQLEAQGYARQPGEGARDYAQRVSQAAPELSELLTEATVLFERSAYQGLPVSYARFRALIYLLKMKGRK